MIPITPDELRVVPEELRILARDGGRLDSDDRRLLALAAEQHESLARQLIAVQAALIESQQQRIALNEQLLELRKPKGLAAALAGQPLSMGTGYKGPGLLHQWGVL